MAFASFFADGTVMRMICHQVFNYGTSKFYRWLRFDGQYGPIRDGCHTRHNQPTLIVILIPILDYSTLTTGTDGTHGWVPAEVGQVQTQAK
jgi:hypothetical protein